MRISEYYELERTQPTLDFVDVDTLGDTRVFIDPRALALDDNDVLEIVNERKKEWSAQFKYLKQRFDGLIM